MSLTLKEIYRFEEFELNCARRALLREGQPVPLPPKAFEVLAYLVNHPGEVVTKEELIQAVWSESFVEEGNLAHQVSSIRRAFADRAGYIVTVPGRGYQFTAEVERHIPAPPERGDPGEPSPAGQTLVGMQTVRERTHIVIEESGAAHMTTTARRISSAWAWGMAATAVLVIGAGTFFWMARPKPAVRKVLVADFQNTTGDPNFDHVLNEALQIDLGQSPYFTFVSRTKARETLTQMQRDKDEPLRGDLAREVCERNNGDAVLSGAIARLGHKYLITMGATDCVNGSQLVESKKVADTGDAVPAAIDALAADARRGLGESRASVRQYSVPLFEANTGSLEALKAFSAAEHLGLQGKYTESVPLYQRAIELDPKFATAYLDLSSTYGNLGDRPLQVEYLKKAYDLRERADEPDRLHIIAAYHDVVTGDLYEAIRNYRTWSEIYPRNSIPWEQLANGYTWIGEPELAIEPAKRALSLNEKNPVEYVVLARALLHSGQLEAAKSVCQQAVQRNLDGGDLHALLVEIAYAQHDTAGVEAQIAWAKGSPNGSRVKISAAQIAFAQGRAQAAQQLMQQAAESYRQQGMNGLANFMLLALTRALSEEGLAAPARKLLDSIPLTPGMTDPVVAMAETGEAARAGTILKQEMEQHPSDTLWQKSKGPQIRAALLLAEDKPQEAIEALRSSTPYDLRNYDLPSLRGRAYLAAKQPGAAELEFRKILDHPGVDPLSYEYPLADLGLARAYAMENKTAESRSEYEKFFTLWKDADTDIPVLKQAHGEYAQTGKGEQSD